MTTALRSVSQKFYVQDVREKGNMKHYYDRRWLNPTEPRGGSAFALADDNILKFADCSKIVSLEFYASTDDNLKELDAIEYKIDTLFDVVKKYRQYIKKELKKIRKEKSE